MIARTGYILCVCLCSLAYRSFSQNVGEVLKADPITWSGGVNLMQSYYHADGIDNRRDPYFWQLNADLQLEFFGVVRAPFSVTLSSQERRFAQPEPFNRIGISPEYRGIKLHLGYRSMRFGEYCLAGQQFMGAGVELTPADSPWQARAFYGRLNKPVDRISRDGFVEAQPTYRRMAYGAQVGYEQKKARAAISLLRSCDDPLSIDADSVAVRPEENLVLGISGSVALLDRVRLEGEYAHSLLTRNTLSTQPYIDEFTFYNNLGGLYTPNGTSLFARAMRSRVVFSGDYFEFNVQYRRVDPDFQTHGSTFLNNDLEDLTMGVSIPLLEQRLQVSGQFGSKRNNLENQLQSQQRQLAVGATVAWQVYERLQWNASYHNFSVSTEQQLFETDFLSDTLSYQQVNAASQMMVSWQPQKERDGRLHINLNQNQTSGSEAQGMKFLSLTGGYQTKVGNDYRIHASVQWNRNEVSSLDQVNTLLGPVLSIGKHYPQRKLRLSFTSRYAREHNGEVVMNQLFANRLQCQWTLWKKHRLSANASYNVRMPRSENASRISEVRVSLSYGWRLSGKDREGVR